MDDQTRFWIAQQVADSKYTQDVQPLFREGREIAGKKPDILISDGVPNFHNAYQKEFWTHTLTAYEAHQAHPLQGRHEQ